MKYTILHIIFLSIDSFIVEHKKIKQTEEMNKCIIIVYEYELYGDKQ